MLVSSNLPKNELNFWRISALASKMGQIFTERLWKCWCFDLLGIGSVLNFLNLNLLTPQDLCCCSSGATEGKRRAAAHSVATGLSSVCLGPTMYYYIRTMATFWNFLSKKYLRQIFILGTNSEKIIKSKGSFVISILKVDITLMHWFFLIFQLLVSKIKIFFKYFLDKNSPKTATVVHTTLLEENGRGGNRERHNQKNTVWPSNLLCILFSAFELI